VSFESIIEDATPDPARRLHYLMQYTAGCAKMLVSTHALGQTESVYRAAKAELVKEFGNPYTLARAYLKRIETWKTIAANDSSSLKAFSSFLKNCRGSMSLLKHLQQLNTDLYLQKVVSKLCVPLQISYQKTVDQLEQSNKDINFNELVDFIERQARIAKHPIFSASALLEAEGRDIKTQSLSSKADMKPRHRTVLATVASESDGAPIAAQCATTAAFSLLTS